MIPNETIISIIDAYRHGPHEQTLGPRVKLCRPNDIVDALQQAGLAVDFERSTCIKAGRGAPVDRCVPLDFVHRNDAPISYSIYVSERDIHLRIADYARKPEDCAGKASGIEYHIRGPYAQEELMQSALSVVRNLYLTRYAHQATPAQDSTVQLGLL